MNNPLWRLLSRALLGVTVTVLLVFLITGLFDFFYVRTIVGAFDEGLGAVNWINPHLGKAIIAAVSGAVALIGIRRFTFSTAPIRQAMGWFVVPPLFLAAVTHGIATFATWGDLFDSLGHSSLFYGIDDNNQVEYFNRAGAHPRTGEPLSAVTPENVREVEMRRHASFREVTNPGPEMWFAPGSGNPMLWYVKRDDGFHLFNVPGFDTATAQKLQPATPEVKARYEDAARLDTLKGLWNSVSREPDRTNVALALMSEAGTREQAQLVDEKLPALFKAATPSIALHEDFFRPAFVQNGFFEKAFQGDRSFLKIGGVFDSVDYVVLCKAKLDAPAKSGVEGVISSQITVTFRVIDKQLKLVDSGTVQNVGPGFSDRESIARTIEMLTEKKAGQILKSTTKNNP